MGGNELRKYSGEKIRADLFLMQDTKYREFTSRITPTVNKDNIIGVRVPMLRKYANSIVGTQYAEDFLMVIPHKYFEENNIHAFLIEKIKNYDRAVYELDRFLPYVDNWATCDMMSPKVLGKYPERLLTDAERWLSSNMAYTVRYGIGTHMRYFLGNNFKTEYADRISKIETEEYYVQMMVAWYFATALAKNYDEVLPYITEHRLSERIHLMTIRKAIESFRFTKEQKNEIRKYK